jgi:hypothetical protein
MDQIDEKLFQYSKEYLEKYPNGVWLYGLSEIKSREWLIDLYEKSNGREILVSPNNTIDDCEITYI